jgi:membrane protease YdiL (CAAX protease family)
MDAQASAALSQIKPNLAAQTVEQLRLRAAVAAMQGNGSAAAQAMADWRAKAPFSMPLLQAYTMLLMHDPAQLFAAPLLPLALTMLALLMVLACLPGVLAFPAFYRGTVRARLHKPVHPLFEAIGLRQMWLGLGAMLVLSTIVPMMAARQSLGAMMGTQALSPGDERAVVFAQVLMLLASAACLVPALRRFSWRTWFGDRDARSFCWAALLLVVARGGMILLAMHSARGGQVPQGTLHDHVVLNMVLAARGVGGAPLALLIVAVLVPVYEELVFRGFVLGGLSRHLSFGWANTWQALLFATLHVDAAHFVFYFGLGLAGGWLVKRTRGLAASTALHVANNTFATVILLMAT